MCKTHEAGEEGHLTSWMEGVSLVWYKEFHNFLNWDTNSEGVLLSLLPHCHTNV